MHKTDDVKKKYQTQLRSILIDSHRQCEQMLSQMTF